MVKRFGLSHVVALLIGAALCFGFAHFGVEPISPRTIKLRYDSVRTFHAAFDSATRQADSLHQIARASWDTALAAARQRPVRPSLRTIFATVTTEDTSTARQLAEAEATIVAHASADSVLLEAERRVADSTIAFERRENQRLLLTVIPILQTERDRYREEARTNALGQAKAEARANRRLNVGGCAGGTVAQNNLGLTIGLCYRIL